MKKLYYRGTHRYSFRSGEWGEVLGTIYENRLCFLVRYPDGVFDYVAIVDTQNYELKEEDEDIQ
jgi:hypothetical protein